MKLPLKNFYKFIGVETAETVNATVNEKSLSQRIKIDLLLLPVYTIRLQ